MDRNGLGILIQCSNNTAIPRPTSDPAKEFFG